MIDGLTDDGEQVKMRVVVRGEGEDLSQTHPMTEAHHIDAVVVIDYSNNVLFAHRFEPSAGGKAEAAFTLPLVDRYIKPLEHCNLHGLYLGPGVHINPEHLTKRYAAKKDEL